MVTLRQWLKQRAQEVRKDPEKQVLPASKVKKANDEMVEKGKKRD